MANPQTFQILHISDLHIEDDEKKQFDRKVVLDPLIRRVKKDRKDGFNPEIVAVTGDIAFKGVKSEYELAKKFFDDLLKALDLPPEGLFIVPGNHDVNRKKYRPKDIPVYENMKELNEELEDGGYRADLLKGMTDYFEFVETRYSHLKSFRGRLVPFVNVFESRSKKKIALLGLNSAWMCRKSPDERTIAIGEYQIVNAIEELSHKGKFDLYINLFHHPLAWLWQKDRKICGSHFNNSIILCGHLHDAAGGFFSELDGSLYQFQAGGAYLGSESSWPNRFQYLTFDWDQGKIRLDFRKFVKEKRQWILDADTGDEGWKEFSMLGIKPELPAGKAKTATDIVKEPVLDEAFSKYTRFAINEHRHIPMQGFETKLRHPIELDRVYINLHAHIHSHDAEFSIKSRGKMAERRKKEKLSDLDLKNAFEALVRHKIKDMVILGDPGSGKTTLLKYILVMLIDGKAEEKIGLNTNLIPFYGPLRELEDPDKESFADYIKRVCWLDKFSINTRSFKALLHRGLGIILLDGLDEVADEEARIKTCKWIDSARKEFANVRFIITSRFAGYLRKSRLEGSCLELSIRDFTENEVEAFLVKWFETVETALHPSEDENRWEEKGRDDALALVEKINQSDHIKKLAVNPLMLQIIALVHRDRGTTLPQRRVELYEECTNVLLEKWDMAKGLNVLLTAKEARQIMQPLALWLHEEDERRSAPVEKILKGVGESLEDIGKSQIESEALLKNIRDRSGIFMGYSENEYGFTHLSFQEYLAAEEIRNTIKIETLIKNYGQRWWKEVILLCLALDNPSIMEMFMRRFIPTDHFQTDLTIMMDAMKDSIIKPTMPLTEAIANEKLAPKTRYSAARMLKSIGGPKAIQALKSVINSDDKTLALLSFQSLDSLKAVTGIQVPEIEDIPKLFTNPSDNSKMVLIPTGPFLYGSREDDKIAASDEKPQRIFHLDAFYIDRFPTTNRQFRKFLNETVPDSNRLKEWIDLEGSFRNEKCRIQKKKKKYTVEKGYMKHPVIYVSWHGANAYAKWAEKRLPSEQEWEKAARGTEGSIYPWGNQFGAKLCNTEESGIKGTSVVDRFPGGRSPYGCHDMAGNVWEWTDSWYDDDKDSKVLRGGSWFGYRDDARCAYRDGFDPDGRVFSVGFRCVRTLK